MSFHTDIPRICIIEECKKEYLPTAPRQKCCSPACSKINHHQSSKAYYHEHAAKCRDYQENVRELRKRTTRDISHKPPAVHHRGSRKEELRDCKCPMCKIIHQVMMGYKPAIRPWIYCERCQPMVEGRAFAADVLAPYSVGYMRRDDNFFCTRSSRSQGISESVLPQNSPQDRNHAGQ